MGRFTACLSASCALHGASWHHRVVKHFLAKAFRTRQRRSAPKWGGISMVLCCPLQVLCYDPRTRLTSRFGSDLIDAACLNCLPQDLPVQFSCKCLSAWNSLLTHLCVLLITAAACTCATRCHEIAAAAASAGLGKEQVTLPASVPNAP